MAERKRTGKPRRRPADRPIEVLVNGIHARHGGGVTYLVNLLPLLARDPSIRLHLVLHESQRDELGSLHADITAHVFRFSDGFLSRLVWEQFVLPRIAKRVGIDVTFCPANFAPLFAPSPVVLVRNALSVGATERRPVKRLYWLALAAATWVSLLRCPRAIAVSNYARRDVVRRFPGLAEDKITVVHHGVSPAFAPPRRFDSRDGTLLAVADLYIQKNLHGLLYALDSLRARYPDIRLKIAGAPVDADYANRLHDIVALRGLEANVEFLGRVSAAGLAELYRRCGVFVFPSLVETFGNPLVEAMASGAPIVSAGCAAMPEILGEAALFVDPRDPDGIARAIARLLDDAPLRRRLGELAQARASRFSWEETALRTADVLKECARTARGG
jgi:glycosyltransferase involved in cell wall biosynthesis